MAGHRKFSELRAQMPPERRARNEQAAAAILAALELDVLRRARGITEEELAERLGQRQDPISRTPQRDTLPVGTLREVIEAMGGELVITARFPDAEVRIEPFDPAA